MKIRGTEWVELSKNPLKVNIAIIQGSSHTICMLLQNELIQPYKWPVATQYIIPKTSVQFHPVFSKIKTCFGEWEISAAAEKLI